MSRKCEICGRGPVSGHNVSHSNRKTKRKWYINLQNIKIEINGQVKKAKVCTSCIKSLKVKKAIKS